MIHVEHVMGMPVLFDLRDEGAAAHGALADALGWLHWVDATFSTYRADSQISRLSRGELALADAHAEVLWVLDRCEQLRVETGGYFDVHAASPDSLDPSGLVKGWAIDRAAALLDRDGLRNYAINAGGDVRLHGRALPAGAWRVGIQHPLERGHVAKVVESSDLAIATSGQYERGEHVLDPHTHRPPAGILSVTITGPDLATADAYATAAFAMGAAGAPHWTARLRRGYEALSILADGRVLSTPRFPFASDLVEELEQA